MDLEGLKNDVASFVRAHDSTFKFMESRSTHIFELAAMTAFARHYEVIGYSVRLENGANQDGFRIKAGTNGHPSQFSRFVCEREDSHVEIHMNCKVRSAHDEGIYCVDVAVVKRGHMPSSKKVKWLCAENSVLLTFAEVKKLVVYPMLLAQFLGEVHEIKPEFRVS